MKPARIIGRVVVAVLLVGTLAAPADAAAAGHKVRLSPKVGDAASTFVFKGTKWQPGGTVFVDYYERQSANQPFKSFTITARQNGKFTFRFIRPVTSVGNGLTPRMCFAQRDARFARTAGFGGPGRLFVRCRRFFVEPPTARFWPSAGPPGTPFLLMTNGWYPNQNVVLDLTRPDGLTETYTDLPPARRRGTFIQFGNPFGDVFMRKGETYRLFPGDTSVLVGDYLATVRPAGGGGVIRTLVTVTPP